MNSSPPRWSKAILSRFLIFGPFPNTYSDTHAHARTHPQVQALAQIAHVHVHGNAHSDTDPKAHPNTQSEQPKSRCLFGPHNKKINGEQIRSIGLTVQLLWILRSFLSPKITENMHTHTFTDLPSSYIHTSYMLSNKYQYDRQYLSWYYSNVS